MRPRKSTIAMAPANPAESKYSGHLFLRSVPETTKIAFKSACATANHTMRDVIILLMRRYASAVRLRKTHIRVDHLDLLDGGDDNTPEV